MFIFLMRSLLTPNVVKSLIRHGIMLAAGAAGWQAVVHGADADAVASALFVIGSTAWGWYDAHQHVKAEAKSAIPPQIILPPEHHIVLGKPTEKQETQELNREQLAHPGLPA